MATLLQPGPEMHLEPAEKLVPCIDWRELLNKVADKVCARAHVGIAKGGYKYKDTAFWQVLVFMSLNALPVRDAANELNDLLYARKRSGKRRPKGRKRLGGTCPRYERLVPNESQVAAYLRKLPARVKETLAGDIFKAQVDLAVELGLLNTEVEVYVDYTNKFYYGKGEFPANPCITGVHNGPGTNKARKYCALMVSSGNNWLFAGVFLTEKEKKRAPDVAAAIDQLRQWGLTIKRVCGDREFTTYDLLARLAQLGIPYTGTMKKTPAVKRVVEDYLDGKCRPVVKHAFHPHPGTHYKLGPVPAHLILKVDPGERIRDVRRDLRAGKITRAEAREKVHAFATTERPPRAKRKLVRWGLALAQGFRRRWRIETGFRDANRIFPTSHARANNTKTFALALRMFAYNAWQVQRARRRRLRGVPRAWRKGPTLRRFGIVVTKLSDWGAKIRGAAGSMANCVGKAGT